MLSGGKCQKGLGGDIGHPAPHRSLFDSYLCIQSAMKTRALSLGGHALQTSVQGLAAAFKFFSTLSTFGRITIWQ
jgi:hypothetical protein